MILQSDQATISHTRSDPLTASCVQPSPVSAGNPVGTPATDVCLHHASVAPLPAIGGLTARQLELWKFLWKRQQAGEDTPTYHEMRVALGIKSKSGVHQLLQGLEQRGYVTRVPYRMQSVVAVVPETPKGRGVLTVARHMLARLESIAERDGDDTLSRDIDLWRRLLNIAEAVQ